MTEHKLSMIIEPELPIIDSHHHIWNHPGSRYLIADFLEDAAAGHRIVKTVFVECLAFYRQDGPSQMKPVGETESIRRLADEVSARSDCSIDIAAGIVGFADLSLGSAVDAVLEAHCRAGAGRFKGVRHASGWDSSDDIPNSHHNPPNGLLADSGFRDGFARLSKYELCYDASVYHPQLHEVADLADRFPGTRIILDHIGVPLGIGPYAKQKAGALEHWKKGIDTLTPLDNVYIKLGGIGMNVLGYDWDCQSGDSHTDIAGASGEHILHCIERFGPERCMFESNFPVDREAFSYRAIWNAFKYLVRDFTRDEKSWLFYRTAEHAYRLSDAELSPLGSVAATDCRR